MPHTWWPRLQVRRCQPSATPLRSRRRPDRKARPLGRPISGGARADCLVPRHPGALNRNLRALFCRTQRNSVTEQGCECAFTAQRRFYHSSRTRSWRLYSLQVPMARVWWSLCQSKDPIASLDLPRSFWFGQMPPDRFLVSDHGGLAVLAAGGWICARFCGRH